MDAWRRRAVREWFERRARRGHDTTGEAAQARHRVRIDTTLEREDPIGTGHTDVSVASRDRGGSAVGQIDDGQARRLAPERLLHDRQHLLGDRLIARARS